MAAAAFARAIGGKTCPLALGQHNAVFLELFTGADLAGELRQHFAAGLHLARHLVGEVVRHMAVRAGGAHAAAVAPVHGLLQLGQQVVMHGVAVQTELFLVGGLHGGIETLPGQDAGNETASHQHAQANFDCRSQKQLADKSK